MELEKTISSYFVLDMDALNNYATTTRFDWLVINDYGGRGGQ